MYLKRLEIAGFKSFADRTEFDFANGITAIVGPNGSGKSNITDAIRWVIGEQSAKTLRGAKMEDIIFAGSDTRKPVNFSEVSLTLNNEDKSLDIEYSEVTITRRLYRSGESEYLLNNQSCRLKDIIELLMDTGLGKEAYSIIGQGKIEEILSSKPEDRRGVFEEAAGIVKFKSRKREAKKKLEDTENNLVRIMDLISELEGQVEPLEKQATTAKQYKEFANKLKELNIQIYVHDIEKSYTDWQQLEAAKKDLESDQVKLGSEVSQIDAVIEQKRWTVNQLEKELDELNQKLIVISEKVEQAEGKKEVLKEREKNHQTNKTQTIQSIDKLLTKKSELNTQLDNEKKKLEDIEKKIEDLTKALEEEEEFLNNLLTDHESQIEILKSEYFELLNEMATLRNEIRHISSNRENITYRIDKLKAEQEKINQDKTILENKKENNEKEIVGVKREIEQLRNEYNNSILAEKDMLGKRESMQNYLRQEQQKLNSSLSRHDVLQEMQSDFSGFHHGVKEILKLREEGKLNGVHGAVAELLEVPKEYETAIEVALGSSLQFIVVEKESVGREAINYLKNRKLGRATFLPLDVMKGKKINEYDLNKIKTVSGFLGIAADLIHYQSKYSSIAENLLGQVIIVSDLKVANSIASILNYSKRIVTLDGDIVNPGGSMTGGSIQKKNVGLLGRQRELDELTVQINHLKEVISEKQSEFETIEDNLLKIRERIEQIRTQGEERRLKEQELVGVSQQYNYEHKNMISRIEALSNEINQAINELNESVSKEQTVKQELEEKEKREKELQERISKAESIRKQDETTKVEMNQKITGLKVEIARVEQERDGNKLLVERLSTELSEILNNIDQQQQTLIQLENDLSNQTMDKEIVSQDIEKLRFEKDKLQKEIEEKRSTRSRNIHEIDSEEAGSKELRKNLKAVESGLHQAEVKMSRLNVELETLLKQLAEEYEMSFEWAKQYVERVEDIGQAKQEVKSIKSSMSQLGDVNLGAIEEYERVSERYNFLTSQKEDLVEAKETLYQVIQEVDEEMTKRFKESFDAIREQFQSVFTKLFGGGRADLLLTDQDNLLDTGVEIVAQPPGKKLQNLALLSGGEKALTAITLLFAILRVKPVPFAVLDEVEAALDEANVSRFAEYLREFCEYTQFIVVTHRKGTMEGSDVLYGVTMQESGVSRLVSVKLEEKEEAAQLA